MGLEGVELILAYEEAFGVRFTDEDAARIKTPRDVIDFVAARVSLADDVPCLEQRAFYRLRSALLNLSAVERRRLVPQTLLSHVFPVGPPRGIGGWLQSELRLSQSIPVDQFSTIGDVAAWLAAHAAEGLKRGEPWSRREIAAVVRHHTLEILGEVEYGEDKQYVRDLGVS